MKKFTKILTALLISVLVLTPSVASANTNPATNVNTGWTYEDGHATLLNTLTPLQTQRESKWDPGAFTWTVVSPTDEFMAVLHPQKEEKLNEETNEVSVEYGNYSTEVSTFLPQTGISSDSISAIDTFYSTFQGMTNGTWMHKVITFAANETITMWWNYVSSDYVPYNDGAMATIAPVQNFPFADPNPTPSITTKINGTTTDYMILAGTNPGTGTYSTNSYGATGWQSVTFTVETAGDYQVSFLVYDLSDTALSPFLAVSHQQGTTLKDGVNFAPIEPDRNFGKPESEWIWKVTVLKPNGTVIAVIDVPHLEIMTSAMVTFPTPTFQSFTFYGYSYSPDYFEIEGEEYASLEDYVNDFFSESGGITFDIQVYAVFDIPEDFEPLPETSDMPLNAWILIFAGVVLISLSIKSKRLTA